MDKITLIQADWPAPAHIKAFTTTRLGGVSPAPYNSLNLGKNTGDNIDNVLLNRRLLQQAAHYPTEPLWLQQTHSNIAICSQQYTEDNHADACYNNIAQQPCVVLTADCLPILLCDQAGKQVAAIHAGWRSLSSGIIPNCIKLFKKSASTTLLAWMGPAIGPEKYEVGDDVFKAFIRQNPRYDAAFKRKPAGKYLFNIYSAATIALHEQGITQIYGGNFCTHSDSEHFFSYRRDKNTGRLASVIWIDV